MKKLFMLAILLTPFTVGANELDNKVLKSDYLDYMTLSVGGNKRSNETVKGLPSRYSANTDSKWGESGYLTIGKEVYPQIDLELELGVNQNDTDVTVTKTRRRHSYTRVSEFDIATYSIGLNTRYNATQFTFAGITPNVLLGAGVESIHFDNNEIGGSDTGIFAQIGAGLEKPINSDWSVIMDYRYRQGRDINYQGFEIENKLQIFTIGAKLKL